MILSSKISTHITWLFTELTNPFSTVLIILSIFLLKKYFKETIHQFILILPIVILLKGGLSSQYFAWLIPILIFNFKIGIISSFIFSLNYFLSYFYYYIEEGNFFNINAFALNNNLFLNNVVFFPIDHATFDKIYLILSNISIFLILINIAYFIKGKRNV